MCTYYIDTCLIFLYVRKKALYWNEIVKVSEWGGDSVGGVGNF